MKRNIILSVVLLIFALSSNAFGQSAKDAYKALKKIEVQIQSGIDYKSFKAAYVDAKLEADMFYQSPQASKNQKFLEHLKKTSLAYEEINELIERKNPLELLKIQQDKENAFLIEKEKILSEIASISKGLPLAEYGEVQLEAMKATHALERKQIEDNIALRKKEIEMRERGVNVEAPYEDAIQVLIIEASKELELAYTLNSRVIVTRRAG